MTLISRGTEGRQDGSYNYDAVVRLRRRDQTANFWWVLDEFCQIDAMRDYLKPALLGRGDGS